jgi:hypothetical protein
VHDARARISLKMRKFLASLGLDSCQADEALSAAGLAVQRGGVLPASVRGEFCRRLAHIIASHRIERDAASAVVETLAEFYERLICDVIFGSELNISTTEIANLCAELSHSNEHSGSPGEIADLQEERRFRLVSQRSLDWRCATEALEMFPDAKHFLLRCCMLVCDSVVAQCASSADDLDQAVLPQDPSLSHNIRLAVDRFGLVVVHLRHGDRSDFQWASDSATANAVTHEGVGGVVARIFKSNDVRYVFLLKFDGVPFADHFGIVSDADGELAVSRRALMRLAGLTLASSYRSITAAYARSPE